MPSPQKVAAEWRRRAEGEFPIPFWHITTRASARNILRNGLTPQTFGANAVQGAVSVSVHPAAAAGLLRTAQRMNSFSSYEAVGDWYVRMGADPKQVAREIERWVANPPRRYGAGSPAGMYLSLMGLFHPAAGGGFMYKPATKIPRNEFLWSDVGFNLVDQDVVAVAGYMRTKKPIRFSDQSIEAEVKLTRSDLVDQHGPTTRVDRIVTNPSEIRH